MWKWIKLPKGIALLAFVLPWMTVSCQGQPLARAAGWQLILGKSSPISIPGATSTTPTPASLGEINVLLLVALGLIVIGLLLACLNYSKQLSLAVLITSVASLILIYLGTIAKYSPAELMKNAPKSGGDTSMINPAMLQNAIQINWEIGFWLAVIALIAAGVMAFLVYSGKGAAIGAAAPAPTEEPPPA